MNAFEATQAMQHPSMKTPSDKNDEPLIPRRMKENDEARECLASSLNDLAARLEHTMLGPTEPAKECGRTDTPALPCSNLAAWLHHNTTHILSMTAIVEDLLARLEV